MNGRERLFASLKGEPVDRVPIWLLFPYHPTGYYVDVRSHQGYRPVYEASKKHAVMLNRRSLYAPVFDPSVTVETREEEGAGGQVRITRHRSGSDELTILRDKVSGRVLKPMLASEEDLRTLLNFPVETDEGRIREILDGQLTNYLSEKAVFPEEYGAMMLDLGEPVSFLYHNSAGEEYPIWSLTSHAAVKTLLERFMINKRILYQYCLDRDLADVYFLVGSELAAPPLVSQDTFREWIVPYAQELIGMIHRRGRLAIQHFHGQVRHLLPSFLEMGADALHTIEAPPVGNCTMTEAYDVVGDHLTLVGNIQYDEFRSSTPAEMEEKVRLLLTECRGRRFILSPTAGPFDEAPSARLIENYLTFLQAGSKYGLRMSSL